MHFDGGDLLAVLILAASIFVLAHEQTKLRRELREITKRLDDIEHRD